MTDKQILKKAIARAIQGGWQGKRYGGRWTYYETLIFSHDFAKKFWGEKIKRKIIICSNKKCSSRDKYWYRPKDWPDWKENPYCQTCGKKIHIESRIETKENYLGHLQQMVLEKEPLKYLEKFLK